MKKLIIGALCAICVVASFVGCGSEPVQEEPIVSLKLDSYVAWVDNGSVVDRLPIISGNSGYSIIYPKKITVITFKEVDLPPGVTVIPPKDTYYVTDHYDEVDYSKDILYIHIDNDEKSLGLYISYSPRLFHLQICRISHSCQ